MSTQPGDLQGLRSLAARPEHVVLAVCHELPIRFALNAASGSTNLDQPEYKIANATPYLFEQAMLELAAAGDRTAGRPLGLPFMNASEASSFLVAAGTILRCRSRVTAHGFDMHTVCSSPLIVGLLLFGF